MGTLAANPSISRCDLRMSPPAERSASLIAPPARGTWRTMTSTRPPRWASTRCASARSSLVDGTGRAILCSPVIEGASANRIARTQAAVARLDCRVARIIINQFQVSGSCRESPAVGSAPVAESTESPFDRRLSCAATTKAGRPPVSGKCFGAVSSVVSGITAWTARPWPGTTAWKTAETLASPCVRAVLPRHTA